MSLRMLEKTVELLDAQDKVVREGRKHGYAPPHYPKDGRCTICGKRRDDSIHEEA